MIYVIVHDGSGAYLGSFTSKQNAEDYMEAFRERRGIRCHLETMSRKELLSDGA